MTETIEKMTEVLDLAVTSTDGGYIFHAINKHDKHSVKFEIDFEGSTNVRLIPAPEHMTKNMVVAGEVAKGSKTKVCELESIKDGEKYSYKLRCKTSVNDPDCGWGDSDQAGKTEKKKLADDLFALLTFTGKGYKLELENDSDKTYNLTFQLKVENLKIIAKGNAQVDGLKVKITVPAKCELVPCIDMPLENVNVAACKISYSVSISSS